MPAKPTWFSRLANILDELDRLDAQVLDRRAIQVLFQVAPRRAVQLLHCFGAEMNGNSLGIGREALREALLAVERGSEYRQERNRRGRVEDRLEALRRAAKAMAIKVRAPGPEISLASLPPGIVLRHGLLEIRFEQPVELVERLFTLAQALANDFQDFEGAWLAGSPSMDAVENPLGE